MMKGDIKSEFLDAIYSAVHVDVADVSHEVCDREAWKTALATNEKARSADYRKTEKRRPYMHELEVIAAFDQTWGSTALGFGGIGGAAMTTALTVILECDGVYYVYFGGRFAYSVKYPPTEKFAEDISARNVAACNEAGRYRPSNPTPSE